MTPCVVFNRYEVEKFVGKTFKEIYAFTEGVRKKVKEATGYRWDSSNFYVSDSYGCHTLTISFFDHMIYIYDASGAEQIDSFGGKDGVFTKEQYQSMLESLDAKSEGKRRCCECKEWFDPADTQNYSFAGVVCTGCYNPNKHKAPDTRGD